MMNIFAVAVVGETRYWFLGRKTSVNNYMLLSHSKDNATKSAEDAFKLEFPDATIRTTVAVALPPIDEIQSKLL